MPVNRLELSQRLWSLAKRIAKAEHAHFCGELVLPQLFAHSKHNVKFGLS